MKNLKQIQHKIAWEKYYSIDDVYEWDRISEQANLSEEFIAEFADKLNWIIISQWENLSEKFIWKFRDYVNLSDILQYQNMSDKFERKLKKYKWKAWANEMYS